MRLRWLNMIFLFKINRHISQQLIEFFKKMSENALFYSKIIKIAKLYEISKLI